MTFQLQAQNMTAAFADAAFQAFAEKMSDDYNFILKKAVIPGLPGLGDLKLREVRVLATLFFYDKRLSPAEISELLRYDPATVTRAVHKLVGKGKITRSENMRDTRSILLDLTEEGEVLARHFRDRVSAVFKKLEEETGTDLTDDEKAAFVNTMDKISRRSQEMQKACARMRWKFKDV